MTERLGADREDVDDDRAGAAEGCAGFLAAVRARLGPDAVDDSEGARRRYGANRLPGGDRPPAGVVFPATTAQVQEIVRLAGEHRVSLWPTSAGENIGLGELSPVRADQVVMHLGARMNRVLDVDESLGYAVIEPGVTFRGLRAELARRGDRYMLSATSGPPDGSVLGNALDRGAGYTPYFDHFGMLCGLEVVLADGSVLQTGDGALAGARTRFVNKSGFGPLLDGVFSQANLGIATTAGIWLMPRPPAIRAFAFTFPDDDDLATIIDLVRPLKLANVVPTLIKVTNGLYGLATRTTYPFDRTGGATPLPDPIRRQLEREHGTGAWTVTGAVYGPSDDALQPAIARLRAHFEASGQATYISHEDAVRDPLLKIHVDTYSGEPTDAELALLDWRPGGGATWFLPATPMLGAVAQEHQQTSRRILLEHGFEYITEFVCGPRAARALHIIVYNRQDPEECRRLTNCYAALTAAYDALGCPPGRMPTEFQEQAMHRLPQFQAVCNRLKHALDPDGVIAPGKYGLTG